MKRRINNAKLSENTSNEAERIEKRTGLTKECVSSTQPTLGSNGEPCVRREDDHDLGRRFILGKEPFRTLRMALAFDFVGIGFSESQRSLREVAQRLDRKSIRGELSENTPTSVSALSRCCKNAEIYFGHFFGLPHKAELFVRKGAGQAVCGLTESGITAWALVHEFLVEQGIIE